MFFKRRKEEVEPALIKCTQQEECPISDLQDVQEEIRKVKSKINSFKIDLKDEDYPTMIEFGQLSGRRCWYERIHITDEIGDLLIKDYVNMDKLLEELEKIKTIRDSYLALTKELDRLRKRERQLKNQLMIE